MNDPFPSRTLVLLDATGQPFGRLRLAPREPDSPRWDAIFDVSPSSDPAQAARSEVRWLAKRHYQRFGEHKVKPDEDGGLTVSQADFKLVLRPDEEGLHTVPPAPPIRALWESA